MIRYYASWILPIDRPPIRDGWVEVNAGRIVATGQGRPAADHAGHDLGRVAVMPGLVNAHTHLELSYLAGRIAPGDRFVSWIRGVVGSRRQYPDPRAAEIVAAARAGIAAARASGTALVGDISNTLITPELLAEASLPGVVFDEVIRFNAPEPDAVIAQACAALDALPVRDGVRVSLAAHAPYSVAPGVFQSMRTMASRRGFTPVSVHLAESREETEFMASGTGPWRDFLNDVGAWSPDWTPPASSPVQYLDRLGFLTSDTLAIHGVQMDDADLQTLRVRGTTLVACPRSNLHTGAGAPPVARFYASGVRVAIGTDSLASTADLEMFGEIHALRQLSAGVPASKLLTSATKSGAEALGFGEDYGTIAPGKSAALIAVSLPDVLDDVEEYLVGGIRPEQITWVGRGER